MFNFCTYFDRNYLSRGLALYHSLNQYCHNFTLYALCMDDVTFDILNQMKLKNLDPISLTKFESEDEDLKCAKQNRSKIEYYFTITPSLPLFILNNYPEVNLITYLDADLYFYGNPGPIFEEMGERSIAIISHRFPPYLRHEEKGGIYNVGWLSFRRDDHGFSCLRWWRDRCNEWCYMRLEDTRYADQKYLDDWTVRFENVIVLEHKGANLAAWNLSNYHLHYKENTIMVDDQPLIFFHFHGLKRISQWLYYPSWGGYKIKSSKILRNRIYLPYIQELSLKVNQILSLDDNYFVSENIQGWLKQSEQKFSKIQRIQWFLRNILSVGNDFIRGNYLIFLN